MNFLIAVVENHFARIYIVERKFTRPVNAAAHVVVKETVENIVVVENQLHRTEIILCIYCHSRSVYIAKLAINQLPVITQRLGFCYPKAQNVINCHST